VIALFAEPSDAEYRQIDKGHGRIEHRMIRTSSDLVGYSSFPGLAQVAEITTRIIRCSTGDFTQADPSGYSPAALVFLDFTQRLSHAAPKST